VESRKEGVVEWLSTKGAWKSLEVDDVEGKTPFEVAFFGRNRSLLSILFQLASESESKVLKRIKASMWMDLLSTSDKPGAILLRKGDQVPITLLVKRDFDGYLLRKDSTDPKEAWMITETIPNSKTLLYVSKHDFPLL